jgi:hypothetical protein
LLNFWKVGEGLFRWWWERKIIFIINYNDLRRFSEDIQVIYIHIDHHGFIRKLGPAGVIRRRWRELWAEALNYAVGRILLRGDALDSTSAIC